jgi:YesN/AraC family two-component response regulator
MEPDARLPGSVLYIEDDDATRAALGMSLTRRFSAVRVAENGREGLRLFREQQPDVVVTDITMPGLNGLDMAREMKTIESQVPIIVTTAYSDTQFMLDAIDIGIDGYVLKPVSLPRLFAVVQRNLAAVDHQRQEERHRAVQQRLLEELQEVVKQVRTLSGLLPICASCKKIRDDQGYWTQIEQYVSEHANVSFTHGLCPGCAARLYPEFAKDPER